MKRIFCLLLLLLLCGCGNPAAEERGMNSEVDRQWYLEKMGRHAAEQPLSIQEIVLPEVFPPVLEEYNRLQLQQGFDLKKYAGREITVYTYELSGKSTGPLLFASLYQYKGRIVGGDVHSAALNGYIGPIQATENG